jgi:superfamily II DNA/RNA helicase
MILIANEVMQEGLDLHKNCRRIIHHDLVWNPAQIEQRIGRIDRLGSLTNRLRANDSAVTLDVLYPVIRGTGNSSGAETDNGPAGVSGAHYEPVT